jgi:hypothetical protein
MFGGAPLPGARWSSLAIEPNGAVNKLIFGQAVARLLTWGRSGKGRLFFILGLSDFPGG